MGGPGQTPSVVQSESWEGWDSDWEREKREPEVQEDRGDTESPPRCPEPAREGEGGGRRGVEGGRK